MVCSCFDAVFVQVSVKELQKVELRTEVEGKQVQQEQSQQPANIDPPGMASATPTL